MSLAKKLENTYLNILRYVILAIATISIIAVLITGFMALNAALSLPPKEPKQVKFEDKVNDLNKGITLENFKNDNQPQQPQNQSQEQKKAPVEKSEEDQFRVFIKTSAGKIADNFITYAKTVSNVDMDKEQTEKVIMSYPFDKGLRRDKVVLTFYFETLISLSGELVKKAPEMAKLPEDKKIKPVIIMNWHLNRVNKAIRTVDEANLQRNAEFREKQGEYSMKKASIYKNVIMAGYAFGIFLFIIILFVMVKIERNLRPLQQIADNGKGSTKYNN
jgi:hypothetical protein